jgi:hypothetical protein
MVSHCLSPCGYCGVVGTYLAIFDIEDQLHFVALYLFVCDRGGHPALGDIRLPCPRADLENVRHRVLLSPRGEGEVWLCSENRTVLGYPSGQECTPRPLQLAVEVRGVGELSRRRVEGAVCGGHSGGCITSFRALSKTRGEASLEVVLGGMWSTDVRLSLRIP